MKTLELANEKRCFTARSKYGASPHKKEAGRGHILSDGSPRPAHTRQDQRGKIFLTTDPQKWALNVQVYEGVFFPAKRRL